MKRFAIAASVFVAVLSIGCGKDTRASLAKEGQAAMAELATLFEGVKDADTARAAKPKLITLANKINSINDRAQKLPEPTEAEMKAMTDSMGKSMEDTMMKLQTQLMRVMFDPAIQKELDDPALQKALNGGK